MYQRLLRFILKIFYRLLYHRLAWTYDLVAWLVSVGLWSEWVRSVLDFLDGPRVLELGHGPGHLQAELHRRPGRFSNPVGLDRSPQMGRLALGRLRRLGLPTALLNAQAQALPFASQSFDQVVATFPTEYIADPHTLAEIHRVLAPAGSLVILPVAYITGRRLRDRLAAFLFRATGQAPHLDENALHHAAGPGFEVRIERKVLKSSLVLVIVAKKVPLPVQT
jgi:ubiquinone/menaquinone biosynthesis C-methylase UbiE